jgi:hypothetical protein
MKIYPSRIIGCRSVSVGGVMHAEFEIGGDANVLVGENLPTAPGMRGIQNTVLGIKHDTHPGAVSLDDIVQETAADIVTRFL